MYPTGPVPLATVKGGGVCPHDAMTKHRKDPTIIINARDIIHPRSFRIGRN
jgi:hypothetical protein